MTTQQMIKAFTQLTPDKIRELGVVAVHLNAAKSYSTDFSDGFASNDGNVFSDMFRANNSGQTFAGNNIVGVGEFNDWIETGNFRKNLRFIDDNDIELISYGDGADAIYGAYTENDWIAPTAKILDQSTISDIQTKLIEQIKNTLT